MKFINNKSRKILQAIVSALIYFSQPRVGGSHHKCFPCKVVCVCTCCVTDRKMWEWNGAPSQHCWDYIYFCCSMVAGSSALYQHISTLCTWIVHKENKLCEIYPKKLNNSLPLGRVYKDWLLGAGLGKNSNKPKSKFSFDLSVSYELILSHFTKAVQANVCL